jgi:UDP-N-acetylglucosamine 4,6-dehydratase
VPNKPAAPNKDKPMTASTVVRSFAEPHFDLNGKSILITGGTGSFGRALVAALAQRYKPRRVIVFSRDEFKQHEMNMAYPQSQYPFLRFFIGDVRNADRLEMAMRGIDYVVHAAAMKQVEASEYNPFECIHTNVIGAENVIRAAMRAGVQKVIALSTDKAASPVNLYGASKLASDKIFISGNYLSGSNGTRYSVVRYGNVVGSRGSVVEVFKRMIEGGATSLPITDTRMTRFWITLPQATSFVLSCFAMMAGGEVFVPKIPSMTVPDLCKAMAPGMPTHLIGIRPGEKLHEAMITADDSRMTSELDDRLIIESMLDLPLAPVKQRFPDARPVGETFAYTSDNNTEWLDIKTLRSLLATMNMLPATTRAEVAEPA